MNIEKFKKNKTFFNLIWGVLGKFFAGAKLAILSIIIGRYLGPEKLGVISYVVSFVALFTFLAEFKLHNILIREFSKKETNINLLLGTSLKIFLFFSALGYVILGFVVLSINDDINVKMLLLIFGLSFFIQNFRFLRSFFIAKKMNNIIIKAELITTIIILIIGFLLAYFDFSITSFVFLRLLDLIIFTLILIFLYRLLFPSTIKKWKSDKNLAKQLVKDATPLVLEGFAIVIFQKIDLIMLRNMMNDYTAGQYAAAVAITGMVSFVPVILAESLVPNLIEKRKEKNKDAYIKFRQQFSDYLFWGSMLLSLIIMLLSPYIIPLLYGNKYNPAISVMQIFSFKGTLVAMGVVAAQIMIVENVHQKIYYKSIAGTIVNVILNFILIASIGMLGAVWASMAAFLVSSYLILFFIKRYQYIFWVLTKTIIFGLPNIIIDLFKIVKKNN